MIVPLIKGLGVTLKHLFKKPITQKYPEERRQPFPRFRGRQALRRDAEGKEMCVGCTLCATVCPSNAIKIITYEDEKGERYAGKFELDLSRCIFCGFCAEACPKGAIIMTDDYELADYKRNCFVCDKEKLLEPFGKEN